MNLKKEKNREIESQTKQPEKTSSHFLKNVHFYDLN